MKLFDAHCHLGDCVPADIDAGVGYICNSAMESDWGHVLDAAAVYKNIHPALGIHPWYAADTMPGWEMRLHNLLRSNPGAMVGEIGLDRARREDFDTQMRVFLTQFDMAAELRRTVHLHCVRTTSDMLHIFKTRKLPPKIVIHGFCENYQVLRRLLEYDNVFISFGPRVLDERYIGRDAAKTIPLGRLLAESDAPISADNKTVSDVINMITDLQRRDNNIIADAVYDNAIRVIRNGQTEQN